MELPPSTRRTVTNRHEFVGSSECSSNVAAFISLALFQPIELSKHSSACHSQSVRVQSQSILSRSYTPQPCMRLKLAITVRPPSFFELDRQRIPAQNSRTPKRIPGFKERIMTKDDPIGADTDANPDKKPSAPRKSRTIRFSDSEWAQVETAANQ